MTAPLLNEYVVGAPPRTEFEAARIQFDALEAGRSSMIPWWRDLGRQFAPRAIRIDQNGDNRGNLLNKHILDETVIFARRTLQAMFHWGITNPSREWKRVQVPDPEMSELPAVKDWLYIVNDRINTVLARSNFYDAMNMVYLDVPVFATATFSVEEDELDVIRCVPFAIGTYAIGDDERRLVGSFARRFQLTVRQLVERFGEVDDTERVDTSNFSEKVKGLIARKRWEERVDICHLVTPNEDFDGVREVTDAKEFASYYWEYGVTPENPLKGFLAKEGYDEWPIMVFRWGRSADEAWGTDCPAMQVLGTAKSLQRVESTALRMLEKAVDPPLVGSLELESKRISMLPGDVTYVDDRDKQLRAIHEVQLNALSHVSAKQEEMRGRVHDAFYTRLAMFVMNGVDKRDRTAREVEEISQEKYLVFGAVLESWNETFKQLIDRVFAIMLRRGMIPPAPEELQGVSLKVEYTSAMAQAQKSVGLGNIREFAYWVADLMKQTGDPSIGLKMDWHQTIDEGGVRWGVPPHMIRSDDDVEAMQQAQADAQAQQQQAEQAQMEAEAAAKLASADTTGKNALTDVLAARQAGPQAPALEQGEY